MRLSTISTLAAWSASAITGSTAITLSDNPSRQDLISAANLVKENMMTFYANGAPGSEPGYALNPDIYYWWQIGGMMGQLIQHWHLTGNDTHNDLVKKAIQQSAKDNDYLQPQKERNSEGNDDQAFWAFAAMDAAEYNFPPPDKDTELSWLGLVQAVFNVQTGRWATDKCDGGLKWQIYPWNKGYDYKNMPSNGGLFQISARLARFTGNQTYADWANKVWDWSESQGLVGKKQNRPDDEIHVYDGTGEDKCKSGVNVVEFSYNFGMMLMGSAMMANHTNDPKWTQRCQGLMKGMASIYAVSPLGAGEKDKAPELGAGNVFTDSADEFQTPQAGNNDEPSFKAYTLRWMAVAGQLVPSISDQVQKVLKASAAGAAKQCVGKAPNCGAECLSPVGISSAPPGTGNLWCGRRWYQDSWDGYSGLGEQMSAMSVFQNNLMYLQGSAPGTSDGGNATGLPLTANNGGTSESKPDAGHRGDAPGPAPLKPITTGDKAGAAIMTMLSCAMVIGCFWFMVTQ